MIQIFEVFMPQDSNSDTWTAMADRPQSTNMHYQQASIFSMVNDRAILFERGSKVFSYNYNSDNWTELDYLPRAIYE